MRVKHLRILFSTCATALLGLILAAEASGAATINFLPLGDSITAAGLYVAPLETLLTQGGYTYSEIGNQGHGGYIIDNNYTINGVYHNDTGREGYALVPIISSCLNYPNINSSNTYILLMIGTNDAYDSFDLAAADVQWRMNLLISDIMNIAPKSHLIVAQIIPDCQSVTVNSNVLPFNANVAASVATEQQTWPNISLVNMYPPFDCTEYSPYTGVQSPYMADVLHPNQNGGNLMAQVWYNGIVAAQVPEPSSLALLTAGGVVLAAWCWRRRRG
jgi:lysophospholipase L1-like esterase